MPTNNEQLKTSSGVFLASLRVHFHLLIKSHSNEAASFMGNGLRAWKSYRVVPCRNHLLSLSVFSRTNLIYFFFVQSNYFLFLFLCFLLSKPWFKRLSTTLIRKLVKIKVSLILKSSFNVLHCDTLNVKK